MPCIIDSSHPTSRNSHSLWQSYCGKTVYSGHNPFRSPEEALRSGKPICKACRKAANLPAKAPVNQNPFEPYTLYRASKGEVDALRVVKETEKNYRLESGELIPSKSMTGDVYWRRAGSEASHTFFSKDKQEAITKAKRQLQLRKDYLQSLIEEANASERKLEEL